VPVVLLAIGALVLTPRLVLARLTRHGLPPVHHRRARSGPLCPDSIEG
jgi:hypothetical protein